MDKVIPMSWLNQILLVLSVIGAVLSLIISEWTGLTSLPIYVSISWAVFVTIISVWLSCYLLRLTLKASSPITLEFVNKWIYRKLMNYLKLESSTDKDKSMKSCKTDCKQQQKSCSNTSAKSNNNAILQESCTTKTLLTQGKIPDVTDMIQEINTKCIEIWYKNISNDKSFPDETQDLLRKFLTKLTWKITLIDKIKLTNKLSNVLLLHLKEYRRYG